MRHWAIHRLQKDLGVHAPAWDALKQRLFSAHPMLGSRFVNGLLKHFGDGSERLCVLTAHGEPQAMGIFKPRSPGIWVTFLPAQAQVGPVLVKTADELRDLIPCFPGFVARLDQLCVDTLLVALPDRDNTTTHTKNHALTMAISLDGGVENYWLSRSKNLVKNIRRYERRLAEDNVVRKFLCIDEPSAIGIAVARYAALESQGWKAQIGTALSTENGQMQFYTELMERFAQSREAMVFELWLDAKLVASRLVISAGDVLIILKTTYDEAYSKYAPGRLLLHDVIQSLFRSHPGKTVEFYTDANADQLAWATDQRWIKHVSLYRNAFSTAVFQRLRQLHRLLKSKGKPKPADNSHLVVNVYRHTDEFPPTVRQFFSEAAAGNVECSAQWYGNLVNAVFADHDGVRFYVLFDHNRPVAALPLLIKMGVLGNTVEALGNYYTTLYAPLLEDPLDYQRAMHLIRAVLKAHAPVSSVRFAPMDPGAPSYSSLQSALAQSQLKPFTFFSFGNWYLPVDGNWTDYLKSRSGTLRSTIKRMMKKLTADGGSLELIVGGADLKRGLAAYESVYAASWKVPEPYPEFMPGLIRICADKGWLRMGVVWLNGEAIAAQLWIIANGKASIYKVAYNEKFKPYAPGTILSAMLMEHVIEKDHVTEVDFLIGDDSYKNNWMSDRRERWGIIAYNPKTVHGLWNLSKELLAKRLRPKIARLRTLLMSP